MIEGISHLTFIVKDLDKAKAFFEGVFGAKEVYSSDGKYFSISEEKFFLIGDIWICAMQGESVERSYNHTAFKIDEDSFNIYYQRITDLGLEIKTGRPRIDGEASSLYFYDYDNHLFELHTGTLANRLKVY
ncbi:FosX/FosE/FosI family fosfomycin resistance thiol transferase [Erysipelothrix inopinata]|uniref:FosX/FosE/FosI family fosfomycin resistance thiol transferase n=1 Tax=Erysipelothrix inopinata TaxID=225084 RepID=A0A7G9RXL7_9FIRM|nr:FosX/FosE/FosI family fosfomycin resistance hydrolase [Erysipelothrix inopinata]QNN60342.1 FosX/FosE/FosI family fosfomycin resistance thiol transferase [Erysipelothrix inopinata]